MNCWICGAKGDSGEHLIKASDIKSMFSNVSQQNPIYYHNEDNNNIPMGSVKADRIKSNALICTNCNSNRTAPHDIAWAKLSKHLRGYPLYKTGALNIRLSKIFNSSVFQNSISVHLYFVKLFGCRIVEDSIPIDVEPFSSSILNNKPNPYVFINFKKAIGEKNRSLSLTPVYAQQYDSGSIIASWFYTVGDLNVEILYCPKGAVSKFLKESFHPNCRSRVISFIDFEEDENKI